MENKNSRRADSLSAFVLDCGNSHSVRQAVKAAGGKLAADAASADRLIVPGQGSMADRMRTAPSFGDKPVLAICVGMQMLFDHSEEGDAPGLGLFEGGVHRLSGPKSPHIGWNRVIQRRHPLWEGIPDGAWFYFAHSYAAKVAGVGFTEYGNEKFTSAVADGNVFGVQFHPEKSAQHGLRLIRNFLEWRP